MLTSCDTILLCSSTDTKNYTPSVTKCRYFKAWRNWYCKCRWN